MCIFSAPVKSVAGTCIIVGNTKQNKTRVVYSNKVACDTGNVMVLPVNTDSITLIELDEQYKNIGDQVATGYTKYKQSLIKSNSKSRGIKSQNLCTDSYCAVIKYGPYDVSITKNLRLVNWEHFGGLKNIAEFYSLINGRYKDYSFLIAKIRPKEKKKLDKRMVYDPDVFDDYIEKDTSADNKVPICYEFVSRDKNKVMLPTFHIHDGKMESKPDWDHHIVALNGILTQNEQVSNTSLGSALPLDKDAIDTYFKCINKLIKDNKFDNDPYVDTESSVIVHISKRHKVDNFDFAFMPQYKNFS